MSKWLGTSKDRTSFKLREFKITAIIDKLRKSGVKSLGKSWLRNLTDKELEYKYDKIINGNREVIR